MDNNKVTPTKAATVKLNVGGSYYEVSRCLFGQRPDSMLARLTCDMWQTEESIEEAIFIDRDGEMFSLVLNYLRYGSIELPTSLPMSMFEREMDYYGLSIAEETVHQSTSVGTMKQIKQKLTDMELNHDMLLIAALCNSKYMAGRQIVHIRTVNNDLKHNPCFYDQAAAIGVLNCYLGKFYGLKAVQQDQLFGRDLDFILKVSEVESEDDSNESKGESVAFSAPMICPEKI